MPTKIVVGSQWGDEGKGKIIDILSKQANLVVRSQGGNNAGHTIKIGHKTFVLKLIPSGILYDNVNCLISCGTVINPEALIDEIKNLQSQQISLNRLKIDPLAHVITPWHIAFDEILEEARKNAKIGTTKNGIGPCYADKAYRLGLRLVDLTNKQTLAEKLKFVGMLKNQILERSFNRPPIDINSTIEAFLNFGEFLKPFFADGVQVLKQAYEHNENILFEGAQGSLLDINFGTYPFVTSSSTTAGGICTGSAIGPTKIDETIGVAKAYLTRVGEGPMPTEISNEIGAQIREVGHEFGTNTKRARRIGWLDCVLLKRSIAINGLNKLVVNKLDVLQNINPLKVCYAYKDSAGKIYDTMPPSLDNFSQLQPVYEELPGFFEPIGNCKTFSQLPASCQNYLNFIEKLCNCKICMVGVGPSRLENIII